MPDDGDSTPYDFLTIIAWWNLYGLPVLLLVVAAVVVVLAWRRARSGNVVRLADAPLAVRRIGLIHYGLALRAGIFLLQELLSMRTMGVPESLVILVTSTVAVLINPFLGLGLRRRPPRTRTRWWTLAWYTFLSSLAIWSIYWLWRYSPAIDPSRWPDDLVWLGLPLFLWVVMLSPRSGRAFAAKAESTTNPPDQELAPARPGWPWLSLPVLLFLIVLSSTVAVEVVDWVHRLATEPGELP